ncbi:MAG: hypothetical protein ACK56F_11670, partial [bacterium]
VREIGRIDRAIAVEIGRRARWRGPVAPHHAGRRDNKAAIRRERRAALAHARDRHVPQFVERGAQRPQVRGTAARAIRIVVVDASERIDGHHRRGEAARAEHRGRRLGAQRARELVADLESSVRAEHRHATVRRDRVAGEGLGVGLGVPEEFEAGPRVAERVEAVVGRAFV